MRRYTSTRDIWVHLMLYPGHTLPTAAAPILVGIGLAAHDGRLALAPALAAFVASWMVHVGGVFVDVYQLLARWPNLREHPDLDDAVARGALRLPVLRAATIGWFVAAAIPGAYLFARIGWIACGLGVVGLAAAASYAAGRRSVAQLGLADPVFFVMFAIVAVAATYYVQAGTLPWRALWIGWPAAAVVVNVLVIDDLRDVEFDTAKGWRTTPVRWGVAASRLEHLALTVFAYASLVPLAIGLGPAMLLPLATLPFAIAAERAVWRARRRETLIPWTPRSAFLSMAYAALFGIGLAIT